MNTDIHPPQGGFCYTETMFLANTLKRTIAEKAKLAEDSFSVFMSERPLFGDFSTNVAFVLAKERKTSPFLAAEDIRTELEQDAGFMALVSRVEVKNGYLNLFVSPFALARSLREVAKKEPLSAQRTVLVEYSSPNIGKSLSIAHIRSTIIGDALARMYGFLGYAVVTDSHVGDWGMLAGKLIAAYKLFARKPVSQLTIKDMQELYVHFTTYEKEKPEYTEMARQETVKLQQEDRQSMRMWRVLEKNSLKEFSRMYKILGIQKFSYQHGESYYRKYTEQVVPLFMAKGIAQESQGAIIVDLAEAHLPPMLIQKSDEGFLYATSDLATIMEREKAIRPDEVLYVVANEQALHFEQLFAAANKAGLSSGTKLVHVKFGMILGQDKKKLSTRRGKSILLEEVINEAVAKARELAKTKNAELPDQELDRVAHAIGIAAVKYNDLSQNRNTDIVFDWDKMLSLDGNSAPYIQYTYARLQSILRKAHARASSLRPADFPLLEQEERDLVRLCARFKDAIQSACHDNLPNLLANFLYETASRANAWYEKYPVIASEGSIKRARLSLAHAVCTTLKTGLGLLGISVLEKI